MNKKIMQVVVAAGMAVNTLGGVALVGAYTGPTDYPENLSTGLVITVIDTRQGKMTMHLKNQDSMLAILKGVMFFEGDVEDSELLTAYPGDHYSLKQYYRFDFESEDWVDKATGEELTIELTESLEDNTSRILGFTDYFWASATLQAMNIRWGRVNYGRCFNSEIFQSNLEVICRAEIWEDGLIHYQPYVGWERLRLEDELEDKVVRVYKDSEWATEGEEDTNENTPDDGGNIDSGGDSSSTSGAPEESDTGGASEGEGGTSGASEGSSTDETLEGTGTLGGGSSTDGTSETGVRLVEMPIIKEVIKEVPVEKIEIVEVEKPVEKKIVETVEVQVPVEKTVVDVRETVREVPVENTMILASTYEADAESDTEEQDDDEDSPERDEGKDTEVEATKDTEGIEEVELPELGKEALGDENNVAGKIATFIAGMISASALLVLGIVFRKRRLTKD